MIRSLHLRDFKGISYLQSAAIAKNNPQGFVFSLDKPTVIVGPNGAGKSALLRTIAVRFLADLTGESTFDKYYVKEQSPYWTRESKWRQDWKFLEGLECDTDNGPAVYYRPNHIPGNESSIVNAMMMGFCDEARAYAALVEKKSSGEGHSNRLKAVLSVIRKKTQPAYKYSNWNFDKEPRKLDRSQWHGDWDFRAEILKSLFEGRGATPVVLLDEPEQSLDALAQIHFWNTLQSRPLAQTIIATHSLYPLMYPDKFSFIEAVPGYITQVNALL